MTNVHILTDSDRIEHSGVRGMKWGHRRARSTQTRSTQTRSTTGRTKFRGNSKIKGMSNGELKNRVARLNMEQKYKKLKSSATQTGKKVVLGILIGSATAVASIHAQRGLEAGLNSIDKIIKNR